MEQLKIQIIKILDQMEKYNTSLRHNTNAKFEKASSILRNKGDIIEKGHPLVLAKKQPLVKHNIASV